MCVMHVSHFHCLLPSLIPPLPPSAETFLPYGSLFAFMKLGDKLCKQQGNDTEGPTHRIQGLSESHKEER